MLLRCLVLLSLTLPQVGMAYPIHRRMFIEAYGKPTRCELCHVRGGGSRRNQYGMDWKKRGETIQAFTDIELKDSDGDGISNKEEILAGSNPGDAKSVPGKPGRRWKRMQRVPVPTDQLVLVLQNPGKIEALERRMVPRQAKRIEELLRTALSTEDRLPTIYFALEGKRRREAAVFSYVRVGAQLFTLLVGVEPDGRTGKLALFRAGDDMPEDYRPLLDCLKGQSLKELSGRKAQKCIFKGPDRRNQRALIMGARKVLLTMKALFTKGGV